MSIASHTPSSFHRRPRLRAVPDVAARPRHPAGCRRRTERLRRTARAPRPHRAGCRCHDLRPPSPPRRAGRDLPAVVRPELRADPVGRLRRLRQPRPCRVDPGPRAGRARRRRGDPHLLERPPRHGLALARHERPLRGRPRRGRPLRRRPRGRRRRLHPQHDRLGQPPRPRPASGHLGRRVLLRAPRDAAAVEPARHGAAAGARLRAGRRGPPRGRPARAAPWLGASPAPGARRPQRRVERHRRDLAGRAPRRRRATARRAGAAGCRAARRAPDPRHRRARRRLGRVLGAQGARPVRRRGARRAQRLARRRQAVPRRRRRHRRGHRDLDPLGHGRRHGTRPGARTSSAPSPWPPRARRSASTGPPSSSTRRSSPPGSSTGCAPSTASRPTPCSATTTTAARS